MYKLGELALAVGLAMTSAAFPAMAQQAQQQMPMMGHGTMMGGQPGMMGGQQGMMGGQQGMMGSGMGMGGCPMMGGMMGSGMQMMGSGMQGMMGRHADDGLGHARNDGHGVPMVRSGHDGVGLRDPASQRQPLR